MHRGIGRDRDHDDPGLDQGERTVLEFTRWVALGVQVGQLLELEGTLHRRGEPDVAPEEKEIMTTEQLLGDVAHVFAPLETRRDLCADRIEPKKKCVDVLGRHRRAQLRQSKRE